MFHKFYILFFVLIFLSGCTYAHFNSETGKIYFVSTKEFKKFEVSFQDGDKIIIVKTKDVKAFKGQRVALDALKEIRKLKNPILPE